MGSPFLTITEAAKELDCSERTIYTHIRQGHFRTEKHGKGVVLDAGDVEQLKQIRSQPMPFPINKITIGRMEAQLRRVRRDLDGVMRILNMRYEPLTYTKAELLSLYKICDHYAMKGWPPHAEEKWANDFRRLRFEDLEVIAEAAPTEHPWKPFFRLVATMAKAPYNRELKEDFISAKVNIDSISKMWVEIHGGTDKLFQAQAKNGGAPYKRLLNKLAKNGQAKQHPFT